MMKRGAQIFNRMPKMVLFVKRSTRNQIWKPISMAAVIQLAMRTTRSQVLSYISLMDVYLITKSQI